MHRFEHLSTIIADLGDIFVFIAPITCVPRILNLWHKYRLRLSGYAGHLQVDLYRGDVGGEAGSDPGCDARYGPVPGTGMTGSPIPGSHPNTTLLFLTSGDLI